MNVSFFKNQFVLSALVIRVLLVINGFNQPYYSYGEKSIWQVSVPCFSEQKCVSVFWLDRVLLINEDWVFVSEKQAKEAHQKLQAQVLTHRPSLTGFALYDS